MPITARSNVARKNRSRSGRSAPGRQAPGRTSSREGWDAGAAPARGRHPGSAPRPGVGARSAGSLDYMMGRPRSLRRLVCLVCLVSPRGAARRARTPAAGLRAWGHGHSTPWPSGQSRPALRSLPCVPGHAEASPAPGWRGVCQRTAEKLRRHCSDVTRWRSGLGAPGRGGGSAHVDRSPGAERPGIVGPDDEHARRAATPGALSIVSPPE